MARTHVTVVATKYLGVLTSRDNRAINAERRVGVSVLNRKIKNCSFIHFSRRVYSYSQDGNGVKFPSGSTDFTLERFILYYTWHT